MASLPPPDPRLWVMGRVFEDKEEADGADGGDDVATASPGAVEAFVEAFKRIVWSTYRRDMPPILAAGGSVLTSDAGWGCMVRSGQMMVAEALVRHLMWGSQNDEERDVARVKVIERMLDSQDAECTYSLHHVVRGGAKLGKAPGEWFGPNTVAQVLSDLAAAECDREGRGVRLMVCTDGTVYADRVEALCRTGTVAPAAAASASDVNGAGASAPASTDDDHSGGAVSQATGDDAGTAEGGGIDTEWKWSLLVVVPLRLGLGKVVDAIYVPGLLAMFKFPQSVGCIGGTPRHSLYFVGAKGHELVYLDPHKVQPCATSPEGLSDKIVATYSCQTPKFMSSHRIDPSLAVAFYCHSRAEFADLRRRIGELQSGGYILPFDTQDTTPAYVTGSDLDMDVDDGSDSGVDDSDWCDAADEAVGAPPTSGAAGAGAGAGAGATPQATSAPVGSDYDVVSKAAVTEAQRLDREAAKARCKSGTSNTASAAGGGSRRRPHNQRRRTSSAGGVSAGGQSAGSDDYVLL